MAAWNKRTEKRCHAGIMQAINKKNKVQAPVVQTLDRHRYPTNKSLFSRQVLGNQLRYLLDRDLSSEQVYLSFEQPWLGRQDVQSRKMRVSAMFCPISATILIFETCDHFFSFIKLKINNSVCKENGCTSYDYTQYLSCSFFVDIDECARGTHNCHSSLASCTNTAGSFSSSCNGPYIGDGKTCIPYGN